MSKQANTIAAEEVMSLLSAFSGQSNAIVIKLPYILLLQDEGGKTDFEAAYVLDQLVFWSFRKSNTPHKGWFYKSDEELQAELRLTQSQVSRVKKKLAEYGLETMKRKVNPDKSSDGPKTHYRVNWAVLYPLLRDVIERHGLVELETGDQAELPGLEAPQAAPKRARAAKAVESTPTADRAAQAAAKASDPVEVWRGFAGRYMSKEWHEEIRSTCTDIGRLKATLRLSADKGWNPLNVGNILRAYKSNEAGYIPEAAEGAEEGAQERTAGGTVATLNSSWERRLRKGQGVAV